MSVKCSSCSKPICLFTQEFHILFPCFCMSKGSCFHIHKKSSVLLPYISEVNFCKKEKSQGTIVCFISCYINHILLYVAKMVYFVSISSINHASCSSLALNLSPYQAGPSRREKTSAKNVI